MTLRIDDAHAQSAGTQSEFAADFSQADDPKLPAVKRAQPLNPRPIAVWGMRAVESGRHETRRP